MRTVNRLEDIPRFESEEAEARFWAEHELGDQMLERVVDLDGVLPPPRPRAKPISVRFDGDALARLKVLARRRGVPYQTLLKQFVGERLYEEELRDGLVHAVRDDEPAVRGRSAARG